VLPLPGRVFVPSLRNGPSEIRGDTLLNHWRNAPDRAPRQRPGDLSRVLRTDPCAETVSCAPVAPGHAREPDRVIDAPAAGTGRRTGPDRVVVPVRRLRSAEGGSPLPCGPAETRVPVPACSCGSLMFLDVSGALPPAARLDHPGEEPDHGARRAEEAAAHGGRSSWRCRAGFPHKESL